MNIYEGHSINEPFSSTNGSVEIALRKKETLVKGSRPSKQRKPKANRSSLSRTIVKSKRPLSAYNLFFRDQRHKGNQHGLSVKSISEKRRELCPSVRAMYHRLAAEEKLRQYNEAQKWTRYPAPAVSLSDSSNSSSSSSSSFACPSHNTNIGMSDDYSPWPMECLEDIPNVWDPQSIDFLVRALTGTI